LPLKSEIILGIDPGTIVMGFGIIEIQKKKPVLLEMGVLKLAKYKDGYERLQHIYKKISDINKAYHPTQFAIEAPFFGKNVQSMLKLGRAQGVAIASAMQAGMGTTEYSPKKVKQSVTGNGNASKEQVWKMVQSIFTLEDRPEFLDATDAVAVALCHYYQMQSPLQGLNTKNSWEGFLKNNAHRIKK
jgi:crossover junction endodeoxyribonuclease RuvC